MNSGQSPSWAIQRNLKHPNLIVIPYIPGILCFLLCILVITPCSVTHKTFVFCTSTREKKPPNTQNKTPHHIQTPFFTYSYSALCAGSRSRPAHQCFSKPHMPASQAPVEPGQAAAVPPWCFEQTDLLSTSPSLATPQLYFLQKTLVTLKTIVLIPLGMGWSGSSQCHQSLNVSAILGRFGLPSM